MEILNNRGKGLEKKKVVFVIRGYTALLKFHYL